MENKKTWGIFIGLVIGYVIAKIYLIWAMLFETDGLRMARLTSWSGTPLWEIATRNPDKFTIGIIIIFSALGYIFVVTTNPEKVKKRETPLED